MFYFLRPEIITQLIISYYQLSELSHIQFFLLQSVVVTQIFILLVLSGFMTG